MIAPKITGITLLSKEELKKFYKEIPHLFYTAKWNWLRSKGAFSDSAAVTRYTNSLKIDGLCVDKLLAIRPVLNIDLNNQKYIKGSSFEIADYDFIIIDPHTAIINTYLRDENGETLFLPFNKDSSKGNDFENSDIKQFLDDFLHNELLKIDVNKLVDQGYSFKEINKIINQSER